MGIIFASGFLYLYLLYVQKPLSTSLGDEKDKKGMQGRVKLPCMGYMRLLAPRCVMGRFVVIPTVTVSYCLFRGILGLVCKCKYASATLLYHIAFSLVPVSCHRWARFF